MSLTMKNQKILNMEWEDVDDSIKRAKQAEKILGDLLTPGGISGIKPLGDVGLAVIDDLIETSIQVMGMMWSQSMNSGSCLKNSDPNDLGSPCSPSILPQCKFYWECEADKTAAECRKAGKIQLTF